MVTDITIKIGGESGQGIQTVGDLIALTCQKAGLYIMAINDFESRIRGGHSFSQIRISDHAVSAPHHNIHILVSLDSKTYKLHQNELVTDGIAIKNGNDSPEEDSVLMIPITELAKKAGGTITSNTVSAGACLALLGLPYFLFENILIERFRKKGDDVVAKNLTAATLGFKAVEDISFNWKFTSVPSKQKGVLISGAKAIALGALASDCRLAAFYPMSPATAVIENLSKLSGKFPFVIEQAEDEIAAVNIAIGASFSGVRSMTATSGGGFCLMTEGLGLSGITETPLVIVNAQRPGPATGLPTRTAQGDLLFVIRAAQDEFPRFVFAPGDPYEAFCAAQKAFHLSEKYQVPAIILADQFLNDSFYIVENDFKTQQSIERFIVQDDDMPNPPEYKRYALTPSGVSPRALPCMGKALVLATGNEHSEDGHISEKIADRINMVQKRGAKIPCMINEMKPPQAYCGESELLLVGWGSTKGAIKECTDILRNQGKDIGCIHFEDLWPFPENAVQSIIGKDKKIVMVEQNSTAQLGQLIREQTGIAYHKSVLKYDGRPFYPNEIADEVLKIYRKTE